jgi:hypothetical protein
MSAFAAAIAAKNRREGLDGPSALRPALAAILLLALWLGAAIIVTSVVAPAAFAVLPKRMLAGAVIGRVLPVLFISGIAVGILAHLLASRAASVVPALRAGLAHRIGGALLVLGCVGAQFGIGPQISSLRARLPADMETLPTTDPDRVAFGRLHGYSVLLLGLGMVGAGVLLTASVRRLGATWGTPAGTGEA